MQIRDMRRSEWKEITAKKQIIRDFECGENKGKISLFRILEASAPFFVNHKGQPVNLCKRNCTWLQAAAEGGYLWYTAMFDEDDRFLQLYADLTDGNHTETDNPFFTDMYLDYVIADDMLKELDRDELDQAYAQNQITKLQYERTLKQAQLFKERFLADPAGNIRKLCLLQQQLKKELDETEEERS